MTSSHIETLARGLIREGVEYAFGVSGSGSSFALIEALQQQGCRYVGVGHEAAASLMAGACGRDGSLRAVAVTIKGPGFVNLLPGMMSNGYEGRASVSISEAYASDSPAYKKHKRADHLGLAKSVLKGYARVDGSPQQAARVKALTDSEYPGPVHLDMAPVPQQGQLEVLRDDRESTMTADEDGGVGDMIRSASQPVVVLGSSAGRFPGAPDWNRLRVPVVTTAAGKGIYNERLPWSGGVLTGELGEFSPERSVLCHADLVIGIGLRNDEMVSAAPFDVPGMLVDTIGGNVHEGFGAVRKADAFRHGHEVFQSLLEKQWGEDLVSRYRSRVECHLLADAWQLGAALRAIENALTVEPVLVTDTGFFCTVAESIWRSSKRSCFCGSSVGRFMGTGIPTAVGVSISDRHKPVVALFGDGGVSPYFGEIRIAVRESLPIVFALASDGRYGSVAAFTRSSATQQAITGAGDVQWWRTAEALGCEGRRVDTVAELEKSLAHWRRDSPLFLQMDFEPSKYAAIAQSLR